MGGSGRQWPRSSRINVNKPLVVRLTCDIIHTYQICNPTFTYSESFNPKRYLTNPSTGFLNDGLDNVNSDYILTVNTLLVNSDGDRRYIVKDLLGQGTFGQVVKCFSCQTNNFVAVKVIKNQPAYYQQAMVEISILTMLNQNFDPEDEHHIVRIRDHFVFHGHLCIVFEMLGANLYELVKTNQFRGISLNLLKIFAKQILDSLLVLRDASVIHCDLKPENILLTTSMHSAEIKVIDFGSACMENQRIYSYIQSRFYRSPEVVLGHPYTTAIDMWSFGCIAAELFLGLPLFPGASEYDLMKRMIERLGGQPPDRILRTARNSSKYFKHVGNFWIDETQEVKGEQSVYRFLSESEYESREKKKPSSGKRYFNYVSLEDIIINYPHRKKMTEEELAKENQIRISFIDFLRGLVQFDPVKRWTPRQAAQHPFLTEEPFRGPYRPFPDAPRVPVFNGILVNEKPDSVHGFDACHLTQVVDPKESTYFYSPQYQRTQCNHTNSYNHLGSFGIHGASCLCQDDCHFGDFSLATSSLICQVSSASADSCLGQSPGRLHRTMPITHGNAQGVSPLNGIFRPMSFGLSPSHLYSSHLVQLSPAFPGKQGPNSIAPGREAGVGHYNKKMAVGMLGSLTLDCQQSIMPHWQANHPNQVCEDIDTDSGSNTYCNPCDCYHVSHWYHESSTLQPLVQEFGTTTNATLVTAYDKLSQIPNFHFSKGTSFTTQEMCFTAGEKIFSALPGSMIPNYSIDMIYHYDSSDCLLSSNKVGEIIQSRQAPCLTISYVSGDCKSV